jgi:ferric-dicitrate binding protein FerR (iron transport regulator)
MTNSEEHTYDELLISKVLSNEASIEETHTFEEKYNTDEGFRHTYLEMKNMWENSQALVMVANVDVNKAVARFIAKIDNTKEKQKKRLQFAALAAGIAATFILGFVLYKSLFSNAQVEIITTNNIVNITLPDSSRICINKNSRFSYPKKFNGPTREVSLTGEAYFTIKADKDCPFIVNANKACIRVLGTSFNVSSSAKEVNVSVTTGNVKLYAKDNELKQVTLTKGETGSLSAKNQSVTKTTIANPNYSSWATGTFTFDCTPLHEAVKVLGQYYRTNIGFQDKKLGNCKITAVISNQSLESVLKILEITFDLTTIKKDSIILAGNGCEP